MSPRSEQIIFLNHAAELGGAELSLLDYAAHRAGSATVLLLRSGPLVDELRRRGVAVEVVPGMSALLGLKRATGLQKGLVAGLAAFRGVMRLARRVRRARVIYANSQKAAVIGSVAALLTRRPLVWHLHDILTAPDFSGTARTVVIGLTNHAAVRVIANSQATAIAYREVGGKRPVSVIPNGIDAAKFEQQDRGRNRAALAAELDSGDAPLLALFGRICPWKGQDIAIAALQAIPAARLLLIGAPLFGEEAFEQALRAEAAASGVADRVHFLGFRRDVPALMSGADVVLHCSTEEEPFGRVIVEALLVGTPVIATRGGGASEIMASVDAPYQVEPRDAAGLALTSNKILVDLPAAQAEAAQIRDRAKSLYDLGIVSARTDQVLEDL